MRTHPIHERLKKEKINCIIFDIDGTLYSNFFMLLASPCSYLRNIFWILRFARMRKRLREGLQFDSHEKLQNDGAFLKLSHEYFAEEIGCSKEEAKVLLEKRIYKLWIAAIAHTPLRFGMRTFIGELRRKGYRLGILSDFKSEEKMRNWKIADYFDAIICAEDYGILKPDKRIFHLICDELNARPEECIFVGNHLKYDGIGAYEAGLYSFLFYKKKLQSYFADKIITFKSMKGLRERLSFLINDSKNPNDDHAC